MRNRRPVSGREVLRILTREFGFAVSSQRGSHIKLKRFDRGRTRVTILPNHRELATGTLRGVLKFAGISEEEFWSKM